MTLDGVQDNIVLSGSYGWMKHSTLSGRKTLSVKKMEMNFEVYPETKSALGLHSTISTQYLLWKARGRHGEGTGKPSQKKTTESFRTHNKFPRRRAAGYFPQRALRAVLHAPEGRGIEPREIKPGSTLIHDEESAHKKLVKELSLKSVSYASKDLKKLSDSDNPMNPVNCAHDILKKFLNAHSGFNRDDMQGYLNLFAFVTNPPNDMLEKVKNVIKLAFQNPKLLRYREFYGVNAEF